MSVSRLYPLEINIQLLYIYVEFYNYLLNNIFLRFKECCKSGILLTLMLFTKLGHCNLKQMFG